MLIETKTLKIRPVQAEAEALAAADDPAAGYLAYTVTLKETGIPVGSVGCSYYEEFQKTGITCFMGARYRGKGYAII